MTQNISSFKWRGLRPIVDVRIPIFDEFVASEIYTNEDGLIIRPNEVRCRDARVQYIMY